MNFTVFKPRSTSASSPPIFTPCRLRDSLATSARGSLCLGALLSLGQQGLDTYVARSPGVITGNLTKAALAVLALGFSTASLCAGRGFGGGGLAGVMGRGRGCGVREGGGSRGWGRAQEGADEAWGDELTEALIGADEGNRPMAKTVRVKNSLRTLSA